ncbi:MAG TPA: hypothetical protein VFG66_07290 [Gemmatimonadales bacterium]|nr:hypothetical protein [Gemmatimonadales bacterium]
MYRIELAPGEVAVFRTIEELAVGVRNGVITPRARIYHAASEKWLPIEFHPHYKKVVETPAGRPVVIPPPRPADRPRGERAGFGDAPLVHAPGASPMIQAAVASPAVLEPPPESGDAGDEPEGDREEEARDNQERDEEATYAESVSAAGEPMPAATVSPVLQLPRIIYPEIRAAAIAPAEEPAPDHAPRSGQSRRPLHLAGLAVMLAVGGYLVTSAFSPAHGSAEPVRAVADRPEMPQADIPASGTRQSDAAGSAPPSVNSSSAGKRTAPPAPPASSGFAAALEPRANVPAPPAAAMPSLGSVPSPDAGLTNAPVPIEMEVAAPELLATDSLVAASRQRDSAAIKRILRAVSGKESAPQP